MSPADCASHMDEGRRQQSNGATDSRSDPHFQRRPTFRLLPTSFCPARVTKQNERESFRSVEELLQDFILQIITVQPSGSKFIFSSSTAGKMRPVSAIAVLILGIVVPALAGYIEVSNTTFLDLFRATFNLHQYEV